MWKASTNISYILGVVITLSSLGCARAAPAPDAGATVESVVVALDNEFLAATNPVTRLLALIGNTLICKPLTEVFVPDTEPDLSQLTLQYRSQTVTLTFNLTTAAEDIAEQLDCDPNKTMTTFVPGYTDDLSKAGYENFHDAMESIGKDTYGLNATSLIGLGSNYINAAAAVKYIGMALGKVYARLYQLKCVAYFHCVGHSLGAHICANAAYTYNNLTGELLDHVTGLDPAGPCFVYIPPYLKQSETAAKFVDNFHTDAGVFGMNENDGHVDFFVNGGSEQPGCPTDSCSHSRAHEFYTESVNRTDAFLAVQCDTYADFRKGDCSGESTLMGYNCPTQTRGRFYAQTAATSLYGLGEGGSRYDPNRLSVIQKTAFGIKDGLSLLG